MYLFGPRWLSPPAVDHGIEMVDVVVGSRKTDQKTFVVHRRLLCAASDYIVLKLDSQDVELENHQRLALPTHLPMVFEAIYQWLYSGRLRSASVYTKGKQSPDWFWLQLLQTAQILAIPALVVIAYERFETILPASSPVIPSLAFICGLDEFQSKALRAYAAQHCAYWLANGKSEAEDWLEAIQVDPEFGMDVTVLFLKMQSATSDIEQVHPSRAPGFAKSNGLNLDDVREEAEEWRDTFEDNTNEYKDPLTELKTARIPQAAASASTEIVLTPNRGTPEDLRECFSHKPEEGGGRERSAKRPKTTKAT